MNKSLIKIPKTIKNLNLNVMPSLDLHKITINTKHFDKQCDQTFDEDILNQINLEIENNKNRKSSRLVRDNLTTNRNDSSLNNLSNIKNINSMDYLISLIFPTTEMD